LDTNSAITRVQQASNLHSRYNPHAEAVRYIDSLNLKDNIKHFILIEPGQGFLIPVLRERFKESKIIVLHAQEHGFNQLEEGLPVLSSLEDAEIQKFLELHINIDVDNAKIIEWRPSLNFYKEAYVKILSQAVAFIKRADAGNRTTAAFGTRWVRNFFRNLDTLNKNLLYKRMDIPVIITASGPSLEDALPFIKEAQDSHFIIAASSSVMALTEFGISADLIIATDGGSWALKHLYPCYRKKINALAVNLCAALPSQCKNTPTLLLNDGSYWQSYILHELSIPSVIIGQRGTVSATAVDLALVLSGANIYLAGIDFSVNDIRTHVKPYGFDALFSGKANRFNPFYSQCFTRSFYTSKGESLNIYASWFKTQADTWEKRIYSITDSKIFKTLKPVKNLNVKKTSEYFKETQVQNNSITLREKGAASLLNALNNKEYARNIKQELSSLLFANKESVTDDELEAAIKKTALGGAMYE